MGAHAHPPNHPGLQDCPACARSFVVPIAMLDLVDEGLYELVLECMSCGYLAIGVVEDADLERYEEHALVSRTLMAVAVEEVEASRLSDELRSLTRALEQDAVLPEDLI